MRAVGDLGAPLGRDGAVRVAHQDHLDVQVALEERLELLRERQRHILLVVPRHLHAVVVAAMARVEDDHIQAVGVPRPLRRLRHVRQPEVGRRRPLARALQGQQHRPPIVGARALEALGSLRHLEVEHGLVGALLRAQRADERSGMVGGERHGVDVRLEDGDTDDLVRRRLDPVAESARQVHAHLRGPGRHVVVDARDVRARTRAGDQHQPRAVELDRAAHGGNEHPFEELEGQHHAALPVAHRHAQEQILVVVEDEPGVHRHLDLVRLELQNELARLGLPEALEQERRRQVVGRHEELVARVVHPLELQGDGRASILETHLQLGRARRQSEGTQEDREDQAEEVRRSTGAGCRCPEPGSFRPHPGRMRPGSARAHPRFASLSARLTSRFASREAMAARLS